MSSDRRRTGGAANREWQTGNRVEQPVDTERLTGQVRQYLADCKTFRLTPSEDDAVKTIFGPGPAIRAAYQQVIAARAVTPGQVSDGG